MCQARSQCSPTLHTCACHHAPTAIARGRARPSGRLTVSRCAERGGPQSRMCVGASKRGGAIMGSYSTLDGVSVWYCNVRKGTAMLPCLPIEGNGEVEGCGNGAVVYLRVPPRVQYRAGRPSVLQLCSVLSNNTLTGSVPSSLSALTNLVFLCVPSRRRRLRASRARPMGRLCAESERCEARSRARVEASEGPGVGAGPSLLSLGGGHGSVLQGD